MEETVTATQNREVTETSSNTASTLPKSRVPRFGFWGYHYVREHGHPKLAKGLLIGGFAFTGLMLVLAIVVVTFVMTATASLQSAAPNNGAPAANAPAATGTSYALPSAPDPVSRIKLIEQYQLDAINTKSVSPLNYYFANHNDNAYRSLVSAIQDPNMEPETISISKIKLISASSSKMVAEVTTLEVTKITKKSFYTTWRNTYEVVNDRWLVTNATQLTP